MLVVDNAEICRCVVVNGWAQTHESHEDCETRLHASVCSSAGVADVCGVTPSASTTKRKVPILFDAVDHYVFQRRKTHWRKGASHVLNGTAAAAISINHQERDGTPSHLHKRHADTPSSPGLPTLPYSVERVDRNTTALASESSSTSTSMVGVKSSPTKSFKGICCGRMGRHHATVAAGSSSRRTRGPVGR